MIADLMAARLPSLLARNRKRSSYLRVYSVKAIM